MIPLMALYSPRTLPCFCPRAQDHHYCPQRLSSPQLNYTDPNPNHEKRKRVSFKCSIYKNIKNLYLSQFSQIHPCSMSEFTLTKNIYHAVVNSPCFYTRIQILPGSSPIAIIEDPESNTLEIGIPKKTYLKLFTEGHTYFQGIYPSPENINKLTPRELENAYFATVALIFTTNDHSTVWRVHEQVMWAISRGVNHHLWASRDLKLCTSLATSRLDKINKSSLLWHWLRKLSVFFFFHNFDNLHFIAFLKQILRSMEAHFANHAAAFSLVWLVQIARILEKEFDEISVIHLLRIQCRQKLGDISLWACFGQILSGKNSPYAEKMYEKLVHLLNDYGILLYNGEILKDHQNKTSVSKSMADVLQHEAGVELQWLLDIKCGVLLPYKHILRSMNNAETGKRMIDNVVESIGLESSITESQLAFRGILHDLVKQ